MLYTDVVVGRSCPSCFFIKAFCWTEHCHVRFLFDCLIFFISFSVSISVINISQEWDDRLEEDSLLIERILLLIRNILHIPANKQAEKV